MADNDLTTMARALLNVNTRLQTVEKGSSTGGGTGGTGGDTGGDTGGSTGGGQGDASGLVPTADQVYTNQAIAYSGATDFSKETKATLQNKLDGALGVMVTTRVQKTPVQTGNKGTTSIMPVKNGTAKSAGTYVVEGPTPALVAVKDLQTNKPQAITLSGIGEGLGNKVVAPIITLTLNTDGTLTITPTQGHDYDASQNGALYDPQVTQIITFNIGSKPTTMLPAGKVLWTGESKSGKISLDPDLATDFSNIPNGISLGFTVTYQDKPGSEDNIQWFYKNQLKTDVDPNSDGPKDDGSYGYLNISKEFLAKGNLIINIMHMSVFVGDQSIQLVLDNHSIGLGTNLLFKWYDPHSMDSPIYFVAAIWKVTAY